MVPLVLCSVVCSLVLLRWTGDSEGISMAVAMEGLVNVEVDVVMTVVACNCSAQSLHLLQRGFGSFLRVEGRGVWSEFQG